MVVQVDIFVKERDVPIRIKEDIVVTNVGDAGKHKRDPRKVYVTSTTYPCPRKVVLEYFLAEKGYTTFHQTTGLHTGETSLMSAGQTSMRTIKVKSRYSSHLTTAKLQWSEAGTTR